MTLRPLSQLVFPGVLIAVAACLNTVPSRAQVSQTLVVESRTGTVLPGQAFDRSDAVPVPNQPASFITLDPPAGLDRQADTVRSNGEALPPEPPNFRRLGEARLGEPADLHTLTLRFSATTRITDIKSTPDFTIEQGGSCVEGNVYEKGATCRLLVRFTPQGPGNRLGHITVAHTASATPYSIGLGGFGYTPVINFIPSVITTVPGSYPSGVGLLNGAQDLTTDGGDRVFAADTGNARILMIDATNTITNYSSLFTISPPVGITVDIYGDVWFTVNSDTLMRTFLSPNQLQTYLQDLTDPCTAATTACNLGGETLYSPVELSSDAYGNIFFSESGADGAAMSNVQPSATLLRLFSAYVRGSNRFASDAYQNLYSFDFGSCRLRAQSLNAAEADNPSVYRLVAGTGFCGFSGDGGDARNAEMSSSLGQFAFDAASNLYFTDEGNHRVRRIDYNTGIIRTIAGNGTAGYTGDGGGATAAELSNPTGLAVDSRGQVYIISSAASGQVIRKVTANGVRGLGNVAKGARSNTYTVLVTNTGNSAMTLTNSGFSGANASEFFVDPLGTSCLLTPGSSLYAGQSCQLGFYAIPAAAGVRTATFNLLDNTVNNSNVISLNVTGTLPSAAFTITSPTNGASFSSGTPVTFSVSVTSTSGPAPTGTVQFKVDGANFGSPVTIASGAASTSVTGLTQTKHTLSATYSGDANYAAGGPISVSITVTAVIVAKPPIVVLMPLAGTASTACMPQSFSVAVTGNSGSVPTGNVHLLLGTTTVASGVLANGEATLTTPPLHPGVVSYTAHYDGDAHYPAASSSSLSETVAPGGRCAQPVDRVGPVR